MLTLRTLTFHFIYFSRYCAIEILVFELWTYQNMESASMGHEFLHESFRLLQQPYFSSTHVSYRISSPYTRFILVLIFSIKLCDVFFCYWRYMGFNIVKLVAKNTVSISQSDCKAVAFSFRCLPEYFACAFHCCFCFFSRYILCCCDGDSCYPSSSPPSLFSVVLLNLWLCILNNSQRTDFNQPTKKEHTTSSLQTHMHMMI